VPYGVGSKKGGLMNKIIFASFVLALSLVTNGIAGDIVRLTEHIDEHGKRTVYNTSKTVLEKSPPWKLDKEPPFPIHKAVATAERWIKEKYPKFTEIHIVSVSLSPIWDDKYKDRWYYSITAQAGADLDGISANSYFSIMVLMDGTVVGPSVPKNDEVEDCKQ
jgi:hypothetical protein